MASEVTLSAEVRQNLSSIQKTGGLLSRTQDRLSSGKKVASAVDDAVAYFQGRALEDRARDLMGVKDGIATGVSTIKAAMDGLEAAEKLVAQMKGIALAAKNEPVASTRHQLYLQYDEMRTQLDALTNDAHFNGASLIGNPSNDLTVKLSPPGVTPEASLTVPASTTTASTLALTRQSTAVTAATYAGTPSVQAAMDNWVTLMGAITTSGSVDTGVTITGLGAFNTIDAYGGPVGSDAYLPLCADANDIMTVDGANFVDAGGHTTGEWQNQTALVLQDYMANGGTMGAMVGDYVTALNQAAFTTANYPGVTVNVPTYPWESSVNYSTNIDIDIAACDAALTTLRNTAAEMGANIAILEVRNAYTKNSANILVEGAAKLMNADLNEEGANMVALQTRSQLALQALSFSGKTSEGILQLFR